MRQVLLSLTIAVLVVISASCGNDDTETVDASRSPIAEFLGEPSGFGFGIGDEEAAQAAYQEEERARQEKIAACMKEQGFEYIPVDPADFNFFGADGDLEPGSEEWVSKYGFGITTQWFSQSEVGPDLVGYDDSGFADQMEDDPNRAIVDALSESEQEAYYEALYGDQDDFIIDETLSEEEIEAQLDGFEYEPSGCEGEAWDQDNTSRFYSEFGEELGVMYERMQADPRIVEAEKKIADCVADSGLEYTNMEDLYERFEPELNAIQEEVGYPGDDLTDADYEAMTPEELDAIFDAPRELSAEVKARLADLQEEEITLAKAVNECGGGYEQQASLFNEVRIEHEQQFLDDNADRLAEFQADSE